MHGKAALLSSVETEMVFISDAHLLSSRVWVWVWVWVWVRVKSRGRFRVRVRVRVGVSASAVLIPVCALPIKRVLHSGVLSGRDSTKVPMLCVYMGYPTAQGDRRNVTAMRFKQSWNMSWGMWFMHSLQHVLCRIWHVAPCRRRCLFQDAVGRLHWICQGPRARKIRLGSHQNTHRTIPRIRLRVRVGYLLALVDDFHFFC